MSQYSLIRRRTKLARLDTINGKAKHMSAEVQKELLRLRNFLQKDDIRLTVIFFPTLKKTRDWSKSENRSYQAFLKIMHNLAIPYFDLTIPLSQWEGKIDDLRENTWDAWHPSGKAADYFSDYLLRTGFLR